MNAWPLVYFEGPAPPANRKAETGPEAGSRLLAKVPAKAVGLLSTHYGPSNIAARESSPARAQHLDRLGYHYDIVVNALRIPLDCSPVL